MHDHTGKDDNHNVICLRGLVMIYGPKFTWRTYLEVGDIFNLDPVKHQPHEVRAMVDGSKTLHLYTGGPPKSVDWSALPAEQKRGFNPLPPTFGAKPG
jgi:hypothetical protein